MWNTLFYKKRICLFFVLFFQSLSVHSQKCIADYFYTKYKGSYNQIITNSIHTNNNEIINTGAVNYSDKLPTSTYYYDGWVAKFTPNGSNLFSKRFTIPAHNRTEFNTVIAASDSTFLVSGNCGYIVPFDSTKISKSSWGALLLLDNYGNIIWNKLLNGGLKESVNRSFINHITLAKDGDFIISASIQNNYNDPNFVASALIIRMSPQGIIRWRTFINANGFNFDGGSARNIQLKDGNIVAAGYVYNFPAHNKYGYYFLYLDYLTGNPVWQKMYLQKQLSQTASSGLIGNSLRSIHELANGGISFQLHIKDTANSGFNYPYGSKSINFLTDKKGILLNAIAYADNQPGTYTYAVTENKASNQLLAIDDGASSLVTELNSDGGIINSFTYSADPTIIPSTIISTDYGRYLCLTDRGPYGGVSYMIKTDSNGMNVCKISPANMLNIDVSNSFIEEKPQWSITSSTGASSEYLSVFFTNNPITVTDYQLATTFECNKACCQDIIDTSNVQRVSICEGDSYRLPDNHFVQDSGSYYARLQSIRGCDSIVFVNLTLIKNPNSLVLSSDTCLLNSDSIIIYTTAGFQSYKWNNTSSSNPFYTVRQPGTYSVSVSNTCGSKTAKIVVYKECEFPIFIPNSFSPNTDNLNDVFRIPPSQLVKNHFIELKVFNRWGQIIFESTNANKGWDGRYKSYLQPSGIYLYTAILESLNGKMYTINGTVNLIR